MRPPQGTESEVEKAVISHSLEVLEDPQKSTYIRVTDIQDEVVARTGMKEYSARLAVGSYCSDVEFLNKWSEARNTVYNVDEEKLSEITDQKD